MSTHAMRDGSQSSMTPTYRPERESWASPDTLPNHDSRLPPGGFVRVGRMTTSSSVSARPGCAVPSTRGEADAHPAAVHAPAARARTASRAPLRTPCLVTAKQQMMAEEGARRPLMIADCRLTIHCRSEDFRIAPFNGRGRQRRRPCPGRAGSTFHASVSDGSRVLAPPVDSVKRPRST